MKQSIIRFVKKDIRGSVIVEATILLPIMIMIFAGLVLLAMYLPGRAQLQYATQYVAEGMAASRSDSSISFGENGYSWSGVDTEFTNVYAAMFSTDISSDTARKIVMDLCDSGLVGDPKNISVKCGVMNFIIYKEVYVTATQSYPSPVDLSFVGFPETIDLTVTSTAVVQNGDEFIRNMDIAADFTTYLADKMGIDLGAAMGKIQEVMNFINNK